MIDTIITICTSILALLSIIFSIYQKIKQFSLKNSLDENIKLFELISDDIREGIEIAQHASPNNETRKEYAIAFIQKKAKDKKIKITDEAIGSEIEKFFRLKKKLKEN